MTPGESRPSLSFRAARSLLASLVALGFAQPALALEVTFRLVPAEHWEVGQGRAERAISGGTVYLYRAGEYVPAEVVPTDQPVAVAAGTWRWIAEAPGYVTVDSGTISVGLQGEGAKTIVWPVVPACEIVLPDSTDWRPVERLDVVSARYGSVYPIDPRHRRRLWVPAGHFLAYSVGSRGLIAIRPPSTCAPGEQLQLPPPTMPPRDQQDLLVHLRFPEGESFSPDDLLAFAETGGGVQRAPAATIWSYDRASLFFLGLEAGRTAPLPLIARHPRFRTFVQHVEPVGGSARVLAPILLEVRPTLSFEIDYRPAVEHDRATVELQGCGAATTSVPRGSCPALDDRPLRSGLHRYTFPELDDGLYVVTARIDDEVVHGLGQGFVPVVSTEEPLPEDRRVLLREEVVHGHLLGDGEPVPGTVVLTPRDPELPVRRFPTGENLEYRLTYFGRQPFGPHQPENEGREPDDLLGLYFLYALSACDQEGRCRAFHPESVLIGSGRLDLDLGSDRGLQIVVVDAEDGQPIAGAVVRLKFPQEAMIFDHGEVRWEPTAGAHPPHRYTDDSGRVAWRGIDGDSVQVRVDKLGYRPYSWIEVDLPARGILRHQIALHEGPAEGRQGLKVSLPGDRPLSRALFFGYGEGGRRLGCRGLADGRGVIEWEGGDCAAADRFLLLHPSAIAVYDAGQVLHRDRLEVDAAPPPLRLRVLDQSGQPVAGLPVELRYGDLTVGENELLSAHATAGHFLFRRTDGAGELVLRGVDPTAAEVPEIIFAGADAISLAAYRPGEQIDVVVDFD